jgi:alkylation response protein AidB-like acyl-CoA dehydrogenase
MDLDLPTRVSDAQMRIRDFVRAEVLPVEHAGFDHPTDSLRIALQTAAKAAGVFTPQLPTGLGGGGFSLLECAPLLEEAGYSLLGPLALNCAAPDEGNMGLLEKVATPEQKGRYLTPLAAGEVRSCFAMTEPAPGVGSDPRAVATRAVRTAGGWLLTGSKHFITGADGAAVAIVMAATGAEPGQAVTMFLLSTEASGWEVTGRYQTLDTASVGGHCTVRLEEVFVPDEDVLGEVGEGFRYAQVRLAPARLTHCMRWLGAAQRAHDVALERATRRELFGSRLSDLGLAQGHIADSEIDLHASRSLIRQAAWDVEKGRSALLASSRAKVFVSEATSRVVDRAVQLMGGLGTVHAGGPEDGAVARTYADIRAFRIYDGANEVHRMSIAKRAGRAAVRAT